MSGLTAPPLVLLRSVSNVPSQINSCLSADLDLPLDPTLLRLLAPGSRLWLSLCLLDQRIGPGLYSGPGVRQMYPKLPQTNLPIYEALFSIKATAPTPQNTHKHTHRVQETNQKREGTNVGLNPLTITLGLLCALSLRQNSIS